VIEMLYLSGFKQSFGNLFGLLMFCLKCIYPFQPDQVWQPDLNRHGATIGRTPITHAF
jgi:hypothetical protein